MSTGYLGEGLDRAEELHLEEGLSAYRKLAEELWRRRAVRPAQPAGGVPEWGTAARAKNAILADGCQDWPVDDSDSDMMDMEWPSALQDLGALWLAESPEELWRALVLGGGLGASSNHWDAGLLFRHHHGDGQPGALETTLLLCADLRWRRATAGLIAEIAGSGVLEFAGLAEPRVADPEWLKDLANETGMSSVAEDAIGSDRRRIEPPLRRWAASRTLRKEPQRLDELLATANALPPHHRDALVLGLLDVAGRLEEAQRRGLVRRGMRSGQARVRRAALGWLCELDGPEAARRRARSDPDATVRKWKPAPSPPPD